MTPGVRTGAPFRRPTSGEANDASADGHTRTTGTVLAATVVGASVAGASVVSEAVTGAPVVIAAVTRAAVVVASVTGAMEVAGVAQIAEADFATAEFNVRKVQPIENWFCLLP